MSCRPLAGHVYALLGVRPRQRGTWKIRDRHCCVSVLVDECTQFFARRNPDPFELSQVHRFALQ